MLTRWRFQLVLLSFFSSAIIAAIVSTPTFARPDPGDISAGYSWVNFQTIKQVTSNGLSRYYIADTYGMSDNMTPLGQTFAISDPAFCSDKLDNGFGERVFQSKTDGSCDEEIRSKFTAGEQSSKLVYFFKADDGTIQPVVKGISASFQKVRNPVDANSSAISGAEVYFEKDSTLPCPLMLVKYSGTGNWGLIAANRKSGTATDDGSKMYQKNLVKADYPANGGCTAVDEHEVRRSAEAGLSRLTGVPADRWSDAKNISFFDIKGVVKQLGTAAVGAPRNADIRLGATPAGSIVGPSADTTGSANDAKSTCAINGIGWIVCPVVNFLAWITDASYSIVADMLEVRLPDGSTNEGKSLYASWNAVRTVANLAFIGAFLIIIYSQITGMGIGNYGIKRMLPRLIVAAILVNISFWICVAAVEITNVLGYSVKSFIDGAGDNLKLPSKFGAGEMGNIWTAIAAAVLATAAVGAFATLAMLLPLLLSGVLVIIGVLVALTLRQGFIYMLIIISPLAFVAYLLPNTEGLFKKWFGLFKTLLLMFPIVAFVFAGSGLAAKVLTNVAGDSETLQIMAAGISILPLIVIPTLIKTSSSLVGRVMNNNPAKGLIDRSKKGAENRGKRWDNIRAANALTKGRAWNAVGGRARSRARNNLKDKAIAGALETSEAGFVARDKKSTQYVQQQSLNKLQSDHFADEQQEALLERLQSDGDFRLAAAGGKVAAADRLAARTDAQIYKRKMDDATAQVSNMRVDKKSLTNRQKLDLISGKDVVDSGGNIAYQASSLDSYSRAALIAEAGKIASVGEAEELANASASMSEVSERRAIVSALAGNSSVMAKAPYLSGKTLGDIEQGTANVEIAAQRAANDGSIRPEQLALTDVNGAKTLLESALKTAPGSKARNNLRSAVIELYKPGSQLSEKIISGSDHDKVLQAMRSL